MPTKRKRVLRGYRETRRLAEFSVPHRLAFFAGWDSTPFNLSLTRWTSWEEFLSALKFERIASRIQNRRATSIFSFAPIRADGSSFYSRTRGQVWIDDMDLEIVHFEYVFEKDSPEFLSFGPVRKKTRYTIELTKSIDGAWLPARAGTELFRRNGSEVSQEGYVVEFKGYRKFDVDVKISIPGRQP